MGFLTDDVTSIATCIDLIRLSEDDRKALWLIAEEAEKRNAWQRAYVGGTTAQRVDSGYRTTDVFSQGVGDDHLWIPAMNLVKREVIKYLIRHRVPSAKIHGEPLQLLRYVPGGFYQSHVDNNPGELRVVSGLVYLNDDYEGGELDFQLFDRRFKPFAGALLLFPSAFPYRHEAQPVTEGKKYVLTAFIRESPP